MNIKLLEVVTPPSIYRGFSNWKTFWEEKFTLDELTAGNMKTVVVAMLGNTKISKVVPSVSTWTYYWNLTIWKRWELNLQNLFFLRGSGKGLINSLGLKAKAGAKKYKNLRYAIGNISNKNISKIIWEFENLSYKSYERRGTKH